MEARNRLVDLGSGVPLQQRFQCPIPAIVRVLNARRACWLPLRILLKEHLGHLIACFILRRLELQKYVAGAVIHGEICLSVTRIDDPHTHHQSTRIC